MSVAMIKADAGIALLCNDGVAALSSVEDATNPKRSSKTVHKTGQSKQKHTPPHAKTYGGVIKQSISWWHLS